VLYERTYSTAHLILWAALNFLFGLGWYLAAHQHAPLWARLCAAIAAGALARPVEAALARRHARRRAGYR
jgi:predicted PurR-regulated permease PerM